MARPWCRQWIDDPPHLSSVEIQRRLQKLYDWGERTFDPCFTVGWLAALLDQIDELWYEGRLMHEIGKAYPQFEIRLSVDEYRVAGFVEESNDGQVLYFHMNRRLFNQLFQRKEKGYHAGGLVCDDKMKCLMNIVCHESVHLLLTVCDRIGAWQDRNPHGKVFQKIVKALFGQTDPQHGLIAGLEQLRPLEHVKKDLRKGTQVYVFIRDKWIPGKVVKKRSNTIEVVCGSRHTHFQVHPGLVRLPRDHAQGCVR